MTMALAEMTSLSSQEEWDLLMYDREPAEMAVTLTEVLSTHSGETDSIRVELSA